MNLLNNLKFVFSKFLYSQAPKYKKMKRVFQFSKYLEWKDLTFEEKTFSEEILTNSVIRLSDNWNF